MATFPELRLRRLRGTQPLRQLVQETRLSPADLIHPLFVIHGRDVRHEIPPMPGQYQLSLDHLAREVNEVAELGIPAIMLFGIPEHKDPQGSGAYAGDGIVQEAVRLTKREVPELVVMTDACLCEYTDHGHCGILDDQGVNNDQTLDLLARTAVSQAEAGADVVAPSAMMDGQVAAIREALDEAGLVEVPILAYAAKFASAFYGPFRVAAESAPSVGDRRAYQMDPANAREALREIQGDIEEGADVVMVKPALAYLDIITRARYTFDHPIAAYNVSGEYSMVKAAEHLGWIEGRRIALEVLTGIKRAGADMILTYHAKDTARWLQGQG